jgi:acyl carrier protein
MEVETLITQFICDELIRGERQSALDPDLSLISSGILDSLALLKLIVFVEERFDLKVDDAEVVPMNFETVNRIKAFIEQKTRAGA